jgi:hypothetical protein
MTIETARAELHFAAKYVEKFEETKLLKTILALLSTTLKKRAQSILMWVPCAPKKKA